MDVGAVWRELNEELEPLRLSSGARATGVVVSSAILGLGLLVAAVGEVLVFYDLVSGQEQDTEAAVQFMFVLVAVLGSAVVVVGLLLGLIAGFDHGLRGVRWGVHRARKVF